MLIGVTLGGAAITAFGALIASILAAIIGKICIKKAGELSGVNLGHFKGLQIQSSCLLCND